MRLTCLKRVVWLWTVAAASTSWGAVALWSEEMTALPDAARWGTWDDAQGNFFEDQIIEMTTDPDDPTNAGVWLIPSETRDANGPVGIPTGVGDFGMAVIKRQGSTVTPDPPHQNWPAFTYETRFRINTTLTFDGAAIATPDPPGRYGDFESWPFTIDVDSTKHPAARFAAGYTSLSGHSGGFAQAWTNDGISGGTIFQPPIEVRPANDQWHTVRIAQQYTGRNTGTQQIWIDGTLFWDVSLKTVVNFGFSRSLTIRRTGQGDPFIPESAGFALSEFLSQEVMIDYIRMIDRVLDISEPLLAPGSATFAAADFNQDGAVNQIDLNAWSANFGATGGKAQGDADGDGRVDGVDFLIWQRQFGSAAAEAALTAVPEPSAMATLLACCGAAALRRKR